MFDTETGSDIQKATELLDTISSAASDLAAMDVSSLSDEVLQSAVLKYRRMLRSEQAFENLALAELDIRGVCDRDFGHSTGKWIAAELHEPTHVHERAVANARKLRSALPETQAALASATISGDHVRVIAKACNPRIETTFAALQPEIIERAQAVGFRRWQNEIHRIVELLDQDGPFDPDQADGTTRASIVPLFDGTTQLHAEFNAADGAVVDALINAEANRLFHAYKRDHATDPSIEIPRRPELMARAVLSLLRKGSAIEMASSVPPRVEISLVIHETAPDAVELPDGRTMSRSLLEGLLVDPTYRQVLMSDTGNVLAIGAGKRFATPAQRRALAIRDGGCVFPGCEHIPTWCDAHHVMPHQEGGSTTMENLTLLCRHHHGVTHRAGWRMSANEDQTFSWTTPLGRTIHSQRHGEAVLRKPHTE